MTKHNQVPLTQQKSYDRKKRRLTKKIDWKKSLFLAGKFFPGSRHSEHNKIIFD
jgi:hypothetical protein